MKDINKLGLGTVQFGLDYGISNKKGKTDENIVKKILHSADLLKIDLLDTAKAYGNAEEILGKYANSRFKIISKFFSSAENKEIKLQLKDSLKKLKVSSLYGFLAHRPLDLLNCSNDWNELKDLKNAGFIEKIGFSLNQPHELYLLLEADIVPDIIQVPYNYFDRRFEEVMRVMHLKNCEIHTRSTFLQGIFFMDISNLSSYFDNFKPHLDMLRNRDYLVADLLNFSIQKDFIDRVIIGVNNEEQLIENVANLSMATDLPVMSEIMDENLLMPSKWPKI